MRENSIQMTDYLTVKNEFNELERNLRELSKVAAKERTFRKSAKELTKSGR